MRLLHLHIVCLWTAVAMGLGACSAKRPGVSNAIGICSDTIEPRALACAGGSARRDGETLFVHLAARRETSFVNVSGEADRSYEYLGRFPRSRLHMVLIMGGERAPTTLLLSDDGHVAFAYDVPRFSPDTPRFVTLTSVWDVCTEGELSDVTVWRMTDSLPVMDYARRSWRCEPSVGSNIRDVRWRSRDTLDVTQDSVAISLSDSHWSIKPLASGKRMLAVHDSRGWRFVPSP